MNKCVLFFSVLLCAAVYATAQNLPNDIIITTDREQVHVKVQKVGINEVEYLNADNLEGPVHIMSKKDIISIHYANGAMDVFNETAGNALPKPKPVVTDTLAATGPAAAAEIPAAEEMPAARPVEEYGRFPAMTCGNGYDFRLDGVRISQMEAKRLLRANSFEGFYHWKRARRNSCWGVVLAFCGGYCLTKSVFLFARGEVWNPVFTQQYDVIYISTSNNGILKLIEGVGFVAGSVICEWRVASSRRKAAQCYNDAMREKCRASVQVVPASEGIGLAVRF